MAAGIMAAAMVPIAYYFYSSGQQQARMKAESVAAAYAAKIMNEWIDEMPFDDVVSTGPVTFTDIEGVTIEWQMEVVDIMPTAITFTWDDSVGDGGGAPPPATAAILDAKNATRIAIKDLKLKVQWQSPRDATMGGPRRTQILVTRRARL
jgi:predicted Abi (CAAX) family protease